MKRILTILTVLFVAAAAAFAEEPAVDIAAADGPEAVETDSASHDRNWVQKLFHNGFKINEPGIRYPRFARFLLKVYNWGDRTFNRYDTTYVQATGKNWKAYIHNEDWAESFYFQFPERKYITMYTVPYYDLGASVCFMAVSLSYTQNAKTIFAHTKENRQRYNFNFTSGLIAANMYYSSNKGGAKIHRFCGYEPIKQHSMDFNDISTRSFYVDAYYFFNHRRYAQAAAYCFSKYQLKSAGSWLAGFTYTRQNINIDFEGLPQEMLDKLPTPERTFKFHYRSYCVAGGYGYNWVLKPRRWLLNLTILPSVGYRKAYEDSTDGHRGMVSANVRAMFAAVYNYKRLFASVNGNLMSHTYIASHYTFFNSTESVSATVGVRF